MKKGSLLIRASDYFEIEPEKFEELGVLDPFMNYDIPLFLNPKLLSACKLEEFKNSEKKIIDYYTTTINFLKKTNKADMYWKAVKKFFNFPEPSGVGLGTSSDSVNGKGLTGIIAEKCLLTLKEIVDLEIYDPTMYRILFLVQDNVGVDRISDMICRIIYDDICLYTNNMIERLGIKQYYIDNKTGLKYLKRPNGNKMLLLPSELLSEIPDVIDGYDICHICTYNQEIREFLCSYFEKALINISIIRDQTKDKMRECLLGNKTLIAELLKIGKEKNAESYDYTHDSMGIMYNYEIIREKLETNRDLFENTTKNSNNLNDFISKLLEVYKRCIEDLGLSEELYYIDPKTKRKKSRKEDTSHRLFILVLETAKLFNLFDYSFESKVGNGRIEFKITNLNEIILIEFKLNKNDLIHGYDNQLAEYIKRYQATSSFYVIIKIEENKKIEDFYQKRNQIIPNCEIIEINGLPKPSPSKI